MAALTLRQDGKEVPCGKRSRYWALPSSLRLRPARWRGSFPGGLRVGSFGRPSSISTQRAPSGSHPRQSSSALTVTTLAPLTKPRVLLLLREVESGQGHHAKSIT